MVLGLESSNGEKSDFILDNGNMCYVELFLGFWGLKFLKILEMGEGLRVLGFLAWRVRRPQNT